MQTTSSYEEVIEYILSIPRFAKKIGTESLTKILSEYGNPHLAVPSIHVAGTNGKGSTCAFMQEILMAAGYKVGMFTSPHLVRLNERIRVNGEAISDETLITLFDGVQAKLLELTRDSEPEAKKADALPYPSFFEMLFLMAAVYFAQEQVDVVIYETGMGGRLDATNVLAPEVTVITSVGMDHMQYLGETIEQIAYEKAGIIKHQTPIVTFFRNEVVGEIIIEHARKKQAPLIAVEKDNYMIHKINNKIIDFSVDCEYYKCDTIAIPKTALYQAENAILAILAVKQMKHFSVTDQQILEGLMRMQWAGRMEQLLPDVYIDGAHNDEAILVWKETVSNLFAGCKKHLLFAVASDKDYDSMITHICKDMEYEKIYVTTIPGTRAAKAKEVLALFKRETNANAIVIEDTRAAFNQACEEKAEDTMLFIVGSLYLVGAVKSYMEE